MPVKMRVVQGRPSGKTLVFPDGVYYIGRGAECHIRPNSEWVSRQHCVLRVAGHVVTIRDLGSRNGTLVNGILLEREQKLEDGDEIQVGPLVFELRLEDSSMGRDPPPPPPPPPPRSRRHRSAGGTGPGERLWLDRGVTDPSSDRRKGHDSTPLPAQRVTPALSLSLPPCGFHHCIPSQPDTYHPGEALSSEVY